MPVERFPDTNILLYGYDLDAPAKRRIAQSIIEEAYSSPVFSTALRKLGGDTEGTREVTQNVFLMAFRKHREGVQLIKGRGRIDQRKPSS